ncbi:hypothetical protein M0R45_002285 [Rubus argutus]|uniref:Uncharacterized protein n=1 Tax=Rubus argutus TaxID=59490 RepID=A0AAW1VJG3_RUBAR
MNHRDHTPAQIHLDNHGPMASSNPALLAPTSHLLCRPSPSASPHPINPKPTSPHLGCASSVNLQTIQISTQISPPIITDRHNLPARASLLCPAARPLPPSLAQPPSREAHSVSCHEPHQIAPPISLSSAHRCRHKSHRPNATPAAITIAAPPLEL